MSSNPSDPKSPPSGGLQSMLARLRGMMQAVKGEETEPDEEVLPTWDAPALTKTPATPTPPPVAIPPVLPPVVTPPLVEPVEPPAPQAGPPRLCPLCKAPRVGTQSYCDDCGFIFPPDTAPAATAALGTSSAATPAAATPAASAAPAVRLKGRYQLGDRLSERGGVARHRGLDFGAGNGQGTPVTIQRAEASADTVPAAAPVNIQLAETLTDDEILPSFDFPTATAAPHTDPQPPLPAWPSIAWERTLLDNAHHPGLPAVVDQFVEEGYEYLVEEVPTGQLLWDAWDDPDATAQTRFACLKQVAETLHALHHAGAILEGLRPDIVVVVPSGQVKLTDLSDLLPLPLPPDAPIRASLYTAPELASFSKGVDARSDLYSFGAMIYALHLGRELTEKDLKTEGNAPPFIPRFPDIHPLFGRLMNKTLAKDPLARFPSDEAAKEDPTGFTELIRTLEVCRRTLDNVRLEIAAWTTTGIVRTGNEDAYALLHAIESRQDDLGEQALVLLADGMGGYEAGEIAAALAIQSLRKNLLQQKTFALVAGQSNFPADGGKPDANPPALDVEGTKKLILAALKEANKYVFTASRSGIGRRGMGCTAEAVYVDGRNVVVGHVGDSRTYHLHEGTLVQMTRDQTLVNRLVELGTLTPEEAENHPRKNELQQAIGGQPDVEPHLYHGVLKAGDWVVVCSDGVSNHVTPAELSEMLMTEAGSAEIAARRLVNLVNIKGATDNATVVVIRAT